MLDNFRKYLEHNSTLTDQEFELIGRCCVSKKLRKKQYLNREGEVLRNHAFVAKGFLKLFHVDGKGQEHILQFAPEDYWIADRESLLTEQPSKYNIDAIEDSELVLISSVDFEMLRKTIPAFNDFVNETLNYNVLSLLQRIHVSISNTAEERYHKFLHQFPGISNRVPLHMIASYLGISAETLSRIRSQSGRK